MKVVRIRYRSTDLHVDALKGVGWRAIQGDEWRGPIHASYRAALLDARERNTGRVEADA